MKHARFNVKAYSTPTKDGLMQINVRYVPGTVPGFPVTTEEDRRSCYFSWCKSMGWEPDGLDENGAFTFEVPFVGEDVGLVKKLLDEGLQVEDAMKSSNIPYRRFFAAVCYISAMRR